MRLIGGGGKRKLIGCGGKRKLIGCGRKRKSIGCREVKLPRVRVPKEPIQHCKVGGKVIHYSTLQ